MAETRVYRDLVKAKTMQTRGVTHINLKEPHSHKKTSTERQMKIPCHSPLLLTNVLYTCVEMYH